LIAPELAGLNSDFQEEIDNALHEIDGTANFKIIGGNTAFAVSLANAEASGKLAWPPFIPIFRRKHR